MISFPQIGYMGRLGNQMFQFASTIGIANRMGSSAKFPIENCFNYQESGPFDPSIGRCMAVKCDLLDCFDIAPEYFIPQRHLSMGYVYHENQFGYNPGVESLYDDCTLNGYFQTEKYFSEFSDLIISQFAFKDQYRTSASNYIETIRNANKDHVLASIHVRRGDYVMFPDHHPTCSSEYYDNAVAKLKGTFDKITFVIFSDDVEWCRSVFKEPDYIISPLDDAYSEMCAMSLCDHHIIANSSFSWWGAWLNTNTNKITIAPSRWFGSAMNKDVSDVYCKDWIIL